MNLDGLRRETIESEERGRLACVQELQVIYPEGLHLQSSTPL
jgi:hypothetical protein